MRVAIMQPYLFPYIGYFQLVGCVDRFVVYDNIKYTKKGWINRNRMLVRGTDEMFSVPIRKDSDSLDVVQRELGEAWPDERTRLLNRFRANYRKAPEFERTMALVEACLSHPDTNLFGFLLNSIRAVCSHLGIATPLVVSSGVAADHTLRSQDRVIAICKALGASEYVNPIGGLELYEPETFRAHGINLLFHRARAVPYEQAGGEFVPFLSIIDVLMFNPTNEVARMVREDFSLTPDGSANPLPES
jgi:hypothetical protein